MSESASTKAPNRLSGGFRRRSIAAVIDWILVGVLLTGVAMAAYGPTNGRIRMERAVFSTTQCKEVHDVRGATLPKGFRADSARLCITSLAGREINRYITFAQNTPYADGTGYSTDHFGIALTPDMKIVKPHFLDADLGIVLLVLLTALEATFLTTLGKAVMGLKLVGADGERPSIWGCWGRNTSLYLGWAAASLPGMAQLATVSVTTLANGHLGFTWGTTPLSGLGAIVLVLFLAPQIAMIFQRPNPFYDLWAGARVVRR